MECSRGTNCGSSDSFGLLRFPTRSTLRQRGRGLHRELPPRRGIPGFDVEGGILPPPPPQDIYFAARDDARLLPNGEITALRTGQPRICGDSGSVTTCDFRPYASSPRKWRQRPVIMFQVTSLYPQILKALCVLEAFVRGACMSTHSLPIYNYSYSNIYISGQVTSCGLHTGLAGYASTACTASPVCC